MGCVYLFRSGVCFLIPPDQMAGDSCKEWKGTTQDNVWKYVSNMWGATFHHFDPQKVYDEHFGLLYDIYAKTSPPKQQQQESKQKAETK